MDAYAETPIEEFGAALLRGMGWIEGQAIGTRNKGLPVPIEYVPRPSRLGLGATPKDEALPTKKKPLKPGEAREAKVCRIEIFMRFCLR